jgi:hypothetical protein
MSTELEYAPASASLAPVAPSERLALVPLGRPLENLLQAVTLAQGLIEAGLIPDTLKRNPKDIVVILTYGAELGLLPMQSIQGIYVVKGRPMLSAQLWAAKIAQAHHRLSVLESTDTSAHVRITRGDNGETFEEEFTLEDAERAGLTGIHEGRARARSPKGEKLPWEQWTRAMLRYRALVFCARVACPEVCFGAGIHGEEYDQQDEPDLRPTEIKIEQVTEGTDVTGADTAAELAALAARAVADKVVPTEEDVAAENAAFTAAYAR